MKDEVMQELSNVTLFLKDEFSKIRTGRAHSSLVESIGVEVYGSMTPINQIASISIPEPRTLAISPWDKHLLNDIEKALRKSDIGVTPLNDGATIRIILPSLTEESRKDLVKIVHKKSEEARIRMRNVREHFVKNIEKSQESGEISEDEKFKQRQIIQKSVDECNANIEALRLEKEKEVMTL